MFFHVELISCMQLCPYRQLSLQLRHFEPCRHVLDGEYARKSVSEAGFRVSAHMCLSSNVKRFNALHMQTPWSGREFPVCVCGSELFRWSGTGPKEGSTPYSLKQPQAGACRRVLIVHISSRSYAMCIVSAAGIYSRSRPALIPSLLHEPVTESNASTT